MDTVLTTALTSPATDKAEVILAQRFDEIMRQHQRRVYRVPSAGQGMPTRPILSLRNASCGPTRSAPAFAVNAGSKHGSCASRSIWCATTAETAARRSGRDWLAWMTAKTMALRGPPVPRVNRPRLSAPCWRARNWEAAWNALSSLSPQQRAIFFLRYEEEMPLAQIADLLQVTVGSVAQLARATGKLREMKERQWR